MIGIHALLCWISLFASFTSAYLLPGQAGLRILDRNVNDTTAYLANSLSRRSTIRTVNSSSGVPSRESARSYPRGPIKGTAIGNSNDILNATAGVTSCVFVVQDVVSIRYWAHYVTQIYSLSVNITSTITKVTKYIDTTITEVRTTVVQSTSVATTVYDVGINPLTVPPHTPGPSQDIQSLNGSVVTTLGLVITSPQPFYVYNSAILITQPAIKQKNGNFACITVSIKTYRNIAGGICTSEFSNINPYVAYYWSAAGTERSVSTMRHFTTGDVVTSTYVTIKNVKIVLDQPFIYQPDWGILSSYPGYPPRVETKTRLEGPQIRERPYDGRDPLHGKGYPGYGYEDFGYIPQALVGYLSRDSGLSSRFFQSISLIPGGPEMNPVNPCSFYIVAPAHALGVVGLHDSSEETINVVGCFRPGGCPGANGAAAAVTAPVTEPATQSASVPGCMSLSPPAIKTQTANVQGSLTAPAEAARSSDAGAVKAPPPRILPLQSSSTALSNGGTPGQQLPPQPNNTPVAPAQISNAARPGENPPSRPEPNSSLQAPNGNRQGPKPPLQSSSDFNAPTQDFNGVTSDQQSPNQPDSNSASPVQNVNGDTSNDEISSDSISKFKAAAQLLNKAISDQQLTSHSDPNPILPTSNSNDGMQERIFSSQSSSDFVASEQNFDEATFDQELSPQSEPNPQSPKSLTGGAQRQKLPSKFQDSFPQASRIITAVENPETAKPAAPPVITIGPLMLTADSKQNFIIGSRTLAPGSSAIEAFGSTFFLLPSASALVVNGVTSPLTVVQTLPTLGDIIVQGINGLQIDQEQNQKAILTSAITIDDQPFAANPALFVFNQGQTLAVDGTSVVVAGASFARAPSNLAVVINGVTITLQASDAVPSHVLALADDGRIIITDAPGQPSLDVQVLGPDGGPITVSSIAGQDSAIVVSGTAIQPKPSSSGIISAASLIQVISELVIDGQTAFPGGTPITASGVPISLPPSGNEIIVGDSTKRVPSGPIVSLTIGSKTILATLKNGYVIGDQTLTPGAAATSLVPGGSEPAFQKTATSVFDAGQTTQSSSEGFTGDAATGLPGLKTVAAIVAISFSLGFSF